MRHDPAHDGAPRTRRLTAGVVASCLAGAALVAVFALAYPSGGKTPSVEPGNTPPTETGRAASDRPTIVYAMPITVAAIPAYVAHEQGFWAEEGLLVERRMFSAGRLALDALLSNSAEVMSVSETPLVHAIRKGHDIRIVLTVTEHREAKFIGRRDRGITSPADVRGKRVATLPGTNSDYFMYEFLAAHDIPVSEVAITNLTPPDMVTSLVSGDIDGYFAWEPHITYAAERVPDQAEVMPPGELYHGRHCIAMNKPFVDEHPEVVVKLVRGFLRAEAFVRDHPDEAKQIVAEVTGLERATLDALWDEYQVVVQLDERLVDILDQERDWARGLDESEAAAAADMRGFIYPDALRAVRPERARLGD